MTVRFVVANNRSVSFALDKYDTTQSLIIDPTLGYSVIIGGGDADTGEAIAVDSSGAVYLTGTTSSFNFPITNFLTYTASRPTAFITKVNPAGTAIVYSTLLGVGADAHSIAVDSAGSAYVTGVASSSARRSRALRTRRIGSVCASRSLIRCR